MPNLLPAVWTVQPHLYIFSHLFPIPTPASNICETFEKAASTAVQNTSLKAGYKRKHQENVTLKVNYNNYCKELRRDQRLSTEIQYC